MKKICLPLCFYLLLPVWLSAQKPELRFPTGNPGAYIDVSFSNDGKYVLTASSLEMVLWETASGRRLRSVKLDERTAGIGAIKCASNLRAAVLSLGVQDPFRSLWDGRSDHLDGFFTEYFPETFSASGRFAFYASSEMDSLRAYDLEKKQEIAFGVRPEGNFYPHPGDDFKLAIVYNEVETKRATITWADLRAGTQKQISLEGDRIVDLFWINKQGDILVRLEDEGSGSSTFKTVNLNSGLVGKSLGIVKDKINRVFPPKPEDRIWITTETNQLHCLLFNQEPALQLLMPDMKLPASKKAYDEEQESAGYLDIFSPPFQSTPEGELLTIVRPDTAHIQIWSVLKHQILWSVKFNAAQIFLPFGGQGPGGRLAFSPDGRFLLTGGEDGRLRLWDSRTGELIRNFSSGETHEISDAQLTDKLQFQVESGSGAWTFDPKTAVVAAGKKQFAKPGIVSAGVKEWRGGGLQPIVFSLEQQKLTSENGEWELRWFLWDGNYTETDVPEITLLNLKTGKKIEIPGQYAWVTTARFSPDNGLVLIGRDDDAIKVVRTSDGQILNTLKGHPDDVTGIHITRDNHYAVSRSRSGYDIKLWDLPQGKELATLYFSGREDWVALTPGGLFDASPGMMAQMYYVLDREVIALDQLKTRYYEPYLLQKILGILPGGLRAVDELDHVPLYPEVLEAGIQNDRLKVRLLARSGGIGKVALELDGLELLADANPARQADFQVDLKPYHGFFSPLKPNQLSLKLYNQAGWLESQPFVLQHPYDGVSARDPNNPDKPKKSLNQLRDGNLEKIHFYALVVGTSKYADTTLNLKYPEKDAAIFADALRKAGGKLFKDRVEVQVLSTETEPWPRKPAIRKALRDISAKAGPDDILLVYFSGHGITYPPVSEASQFYYLTTDIAGDKLQDEAILNTRAIAQDSLMDWVRQIKARKRILIYDACNSGSVVTQFEQGAKELNTDQRRALERMKDRAGMYVLAGSAANKSSFEASNYGHGLLTYSLINGMLKVAAQNQGSVELGDLFTFVEDDVERLAKNINREQRPEVIKAESYPIGIIDKDTDIKMPVELPVFVRVTMIDSKKNKDLLGLSKTLNGELERLTAEKDPALVFWDVESFEGKYYYLGGQYQSMEGNITGNVSLYLQDTELTTFPISGSVDGLGKLAKDLVFEVRAYLGKNGGK